MANHYLPTVKSEDDFEGKECTCDRGIYAQECPYSCEMAEEGDEIEECGCCPWHVAQCADDV